MKKNSLTVNNGLSLSQAQSVSNLCNQKAAEITSKLGIINNFSKKITLEGKEHTLVKGNKIPNNIVDLLKEKAELHACQAFLMENIKAKDELLKSIKNETADLSGIESPEVPKTYSPLNNQLPMVNEEYGMSQLTVSEINEYLEAEAFASHFGQFIHKDSVLSRLRSELSTIPSIDWITIKDGEKMPVSIEVHHTSEELYDIHENIAKLHREYEQRVNYYKAKVKNIVTEENARIAKLNAEAQNDADKKNKELYVKYDVEYKLYLDKVRSVQADFEIKRQERIKEVASMRISVDPRFKKTVDKFLNALPAEPTN